MEEEGFQFIQYLRYLALVEARDDVGDEKRALVVQCDVVEGADRLREQEEGEER